MIELSRSVYNALVDHALAGRPAEVCGVLEGDRGSTSRATEHHRAENVAEDPRTEYRIAPAELLELTTLVEEEHGADVVGFYHSHPRGPAGPSDTDVARAAWPDHSYVVVVLGGDHPYVGSWRWTGETFEAEAVSLVPDPPPDA